MLAIDSLQTGNTKTMRAASIYRLLSSAVLMSTNSVDDGELRSLIGFTGEYTTVELGDDLDSIVKIPFIMSADYCHIISRRPREIVQAMDRLLVSTVGNYGWIRSIVRLATTANDTPLMHEDSPSLGRPYELVVILLNDNPDVDNTGIKPENLNREVPLVIIDKDYDAEDLLQYFSPDTVKIAIV